MRQNDIGLVCPDGFEAGFDVLAGLLDLRPHVALADNLAFTIERRLASDDNFPFTVFRRNDDRRRLFAAGRSDNYRLGLIFDEFPGLVGALNVFGGFFAPYLGPMTIM